ncbi:MAG TPA: hypothetical protein ENJ37_07325 [Deltaproteobacteria bacterium]|nr:hypothetical protein [Deltaproteobacteria bacterium]
MREAAHPRDGVFCPATIEPFDGRDGRPAYVAYEGRVFDVTDSALWRGGEHMARHRAGRDMTAELKKAPHGPEMLEKAKLIGAYDRTRTAPKTPAQRAFHVLAYWNLAVVFAVLFVISLWRWG